MRRIGSVLTAVCLLLAASGPGFAHATNTAAPSAAVQTTTPPAPDFRHVMVELEEAPATAVYATAQAAAVNQADLVAATRAQLAAVEMEQQTLLHALATIDGQVLYRIQRVYNGVALRVRADQVAQVAALPGVRAVHELTPKEPANAVSVPFIGAPALWSGLGGRPLTGAGMTIAVIDTGVDYLHAAFGGSRRYRDNDPTRIGDVPDFPGAKVIAGYDFAGDAYDADPDSPTYNPVPAPDPDPTDCYDHGTHVAATVAGVGVLSDATGGFGGVYAGPYDATVQQTPFLIAPGVAPEATIIALKVFGCQGSSDLTELAIEWAVDPNGDGDFADKVDVINMSLGSTYGSIYDPSSVASNNAALAGVIVVASAGNSGNVYFATGSPAVADRAVSVAAIRNHLEVDAAPGVSPVAMSTFSSRGPRRVDGVLKPDIAAPGQSVRSAVLGAPGTESAALSGTSMAAPHVAGAMALLRQRYPTWTVEELKALVMNTAVTGASSGAVVTSPLRMGAGILDLTRAFKTPLLAMDASGSGRVSLSFPPADVLDAYTDTVNLRLTNKSATPLAYALIYTPLTDLPGVEIRPAAPTVTVPAAGATVTAVELAAVADAMGHPRAGDVNATSGYPRHWLAEEAGHLELWPLDAVYQATLVGSIPGASSSTALGHAALSYNPHTGRLTFTVTPTAESDVDPANFTRVELYAQGAAGDPGGLLATLTVTEATDGTLRGEGELDAATARQLVDEGTMLRLVTPGTQAMEIRGPVLTKAVVIHTPVSASARRSADLRTSEPVLPVPYRPGLATATLTFSGTPRAETSQPDAGPALVTLLTRQYSSTNSLPHPPLTGQADIFDHADLQHIGISSDLLHDANGPVANRTLYFGLVTYAEWSTPNEVEFNIYIDSNEDGAEDYRLFNSDALGYNSDRLTSDGLVALVEDLTTGDFSEFAPLNGQTAQEADTAPFRNNVLVLPVRAGDIGLNDANTNFNYYVETVSSARQEPVEITPVLAYDLRADALDLVSRAGNGPAYAVDEATTIDVRMDVARFLLQPQADLLVLHHHNVFPNRAEVVPVRLEWPASVYLPTIPGAGP